MIIIFDDLDQFSAIKIAVFLKTIFKKDYLTKWTYQSYDMNANNVIKSYEINKIKKIFFNN
jgi:hypothetical protein